MTYRVGQKVVCIYDCPQHLRPAWASYPEINHIYTVRGHVKGARGKELLLLEEVLNPIRDSIVGPCEYGFQAAGFRPIVERKTDISIFTKMLAPNELERA